MAAPREESARYGGTRPIIDARTCSFAVYALTKGRIHLKDQILCWKDNQSGFNII